MPFVKLPGMDREIWMDLHEPEELGGALVAAIGTRTHLTPGQFAAETASPNGLIQTEPHLVATKPGRDGAGQMARSAIAYERARRSLIAARGRPRKTLGFTRWEDFALIVLYFESRGHKQAIRRALEYWPIGQDSTSKRPRMARRHLEKTLQRVRRWWIDDLFRAAELARLRWGLSPFPTRKPPSRKPKLN